MHQTRLHSWRATAQNHRLRMTCGIYSICFENRYYIGSSNNIEKRWSNHRSKFKYGYHVNQFMQRLWNKGIIPSFEILQRCDVEDLIENEQLWINRINPILNMATIVRAPMTGRLHTIETRKRMSITHSNRTDSNRGCKPGQKPTEEHKLNLSLNQKYRKDILCIDLDKRFHSVGEAARYLVRNGLALNVKSRGNIAAAARGMLKSAYGFNWKYIEGVE